MEVCRFWGLLLGPGTWDEKREKADDEEEKIWATWTALTGNLAQFYNGLDFGSGPKTKTHNLTLPGTFFHKQNKFRIQPPHSIQPPS